ncbi:MAG: hypothetical protein NTU73_11750 [Ignavibacteriae bacterium]|nr:hypothetical protein [Ignavibacteriota bacterium]
MENNNSQIQQNKICQFCQSKIKSKEDFITCPSCLSVYHIECWYENKGCAVYGCDYKLQNQENEQKIFSIENILVNAEYFINKKLFAEAINECNRILNVDPSDIEAKKLYNKAITSMNVKSKILEDAEKAFDSKDFKSAEIYYKNSFGYLNEYERDVVNAKLQVIKQAIPTLQRKALYKRIATYSLTFLVFLSIIFITYYYIYLEEDREYYAIEKEDNIEDIHVTENQIFRYEHFLRKYENGKFRFKAMEKINLLSASLIQKIYKDDWKTALKYLNKIDENSNPKLHSDLFNSLYSVAESDYFKFKSNAKRFNSQKKFIEAKNETERALNIANYFPGTDIERDKIILNSNLNLLNRKISYLAKYKDIEKELNEKTEELKKNQEIESGGIVKVNAIITDEKSPNYYIAKNIFDNNVIAIKTTELTYYKKGDVVVFECRKSGKVNIIDDKLGEISVPLYKFVNLPKENNYSASYYIESLVQRLEYLKSQKSKIDSLFSLSL